MAEGVGNDFYSYLACLGRLYLNINDLDWFVSLERDCCLASNSGHGISYEIKITEFDICNYCCATTLKNTQLLAGLNELLCLSGERDLAS